MSELNSRLKTEELIPSYRQSYELHSLTQQVSQQQLSLQLKEKQISYLNSQINSLKEEHSNRIIRLQSTLSENKKEITELRYQLLKTKRVETEKSEKNIDKLRELHQHEQQQLEQHYNRIIKEEKQQQGENVKILEEKYHGIIQLHIREQDGLKRLLEERKINNEGVVKKMREEMETLVRERVELKQQLSLCSSMVDRMKQQIQKYQEQLDQAREKYEIEISKLKSTNQNLEKSIQKQKKDINEQHLQSKKAIEEKQEEILKIKQENNLLRRVLQEKDEQISCIPEGSNIRTQPAINSVRECNHKGLLQQLERTIHRQEKQNLDLKQKLQEWEQYIGFNHSTNSRVRQLETVMQDAYTASNNLHKFLRPSQRRK